MRPARRVYAMKRQRPATIVTILLAFLVFVGGYLWRTRRVATDSHKNVLGRTVQGISFVKDRHESAEGRWCDTHPLPIHDVKQMVKNITMLSDARLQNIIDLTSSVIQKRIPGDLLEAGVWQGGASILMKTVLKHHCSTRHIYCCDSYQGLPSFETVDTELEEEQRKPMDKPGSYAFDGGVETVRMHFKNYGVLDDKVHLVQGYFKDTLPVMHEPKQLAILRMDGDMYSSTMDILENLYDRVVVGGYVIIDDYGHWPQCKRAVHDFFEERGDSHVLSVLQPIDDTGVWFEKKA